MRKLAYLLTLFFITTLIFASFACGGEEAPPTPTPTPISSPTPTQEPLPTPTPTPEPVTHVFNITRQLSGINIILVMTTWTDDKVDILWRIENPSSQPFKASRLYSIFSPGMYAVDQNGEEGEYFIPLLIREDLEQGKPLIYHTQLLFYPESSEITIRLPDAYSEGSTFVDISVEYNVTR